MLESEGIATIMLADDAGSTYPMLQFIRGVRLSVLRGPGPGNPGRHGGRAPKRTWPGLIA